MSGSFTRISAMIKNINENIPMKRLAMINGFVHPKSEQISVRMQYQQGKKNKYCAKNNQCFLPLYFAFPVQTE